MNLDKLDKAASEKIGFPTTVQLIDESNIVRAPGDKRLTITSVILRSMGKLVQEPSFTLEDPTMAIRHGLLRLEQAVTGSVHNHKYGKAFAVSNG